MADQLKVLVIDDESVLIKMVTSLLESKNYQVVTATDGVEGLAIAKSEIPNLIILDVVMPIMDGYSFVKEIKKEDDLKAVPILVLTAKTELEDLFKMEGINHFMSKPFQTEEFLKEVKALIS